MAGFSILAKLGLDSSKFASSLKSQNTAMSKFGAAIGTAVKAGAAIAGAAFAAFTVKGIKDLVEFEKSMGEVFTLLPGITEESMSKMKDSVRSLSTTMGVDLGDATAALYQAISAGVPKENVFEFMEVAAKAAIGGVTSLETAVDGITTAMNTYGAANLSAQEASDAMFTAVKLGKTTFEELSGALFNVLPMAKQAGVSFDAISAALAVMTSKGTPTSVATTQLRAALTALLAPTEATAKAFKSYGLDVGNLKALMAGGDDGLVKAMQNVLVATNGDETAIRKLLGSTEAMNAVFTLTSDNAKSFGDALEEMGNKTGATDTAFETMEKTVGHQIEKMMGALKNLGLSVGNVFLPMINKLLPDLITAFNDAVGPVDKFAQTFPALLASIGDMVATFIRFGLLITTYIVTSKAAAVVTTALAIAKNMLTVATKGASVAMQLFNKVSKANIIGLVVAAAVAAAMAFKQWAKHQEALNTVMRPSGEFLKTLEEKAKKAGKAYENAKDRVKILREQLEELNRQGGLKDQGITQLQDALTLRREALAVLKKDQKIQLELAESKKWELETEEYRLKHKLKHSDLAHERIILEEEIKGVLEEQQKHIGDTLKFTIDIKLAEQAILDIEKERKKEIEDAEQVHLDTKKIIDDVHQIRMLEKTEVGKIHLLELGIRDLELQKKNIIDNSIISRGMEAKVAKELETIEGNILDKKEAIEGIISGGLKQARAAEIAQIKEATTHLEKQWTAQKKIADDAKIAADAAEKRVAALREELNVAEDAVDAERKFWDVDIRGKPEANKRELRKAFNEAREAGFKGTFADFIKKKEEDMRGAMAARDAVINEGRDAKAEAKKEREKEEKANKLKEQLKKKIDEENTRLATLAKEAEEKKKKTLEDLTAERKEWEKLLKEWQNPNMDPPALENLVEDLNNITEDISSLDEDTADGLTGAEGSADTASNREKTQKDLLTTAEDTLTVVRGYFVNQ